MPQPLRAKLSYGNVVATIALFVALGGSAWATNARGGSSATDSTAAGTIHACVRKQGGSLRIVGAATRCARTEIPLDWNVAGPKAFSGQFASPSGASTLDVSDSGITLTQKGPKGTSKITLSGGDVVIDDEASGGSVKLTSGSGPITLSAGADLSATATGDIGTTSTNGDVTTTAKEGNIATTADQGNLTTTAEEGNIATTAGKGNLTTTAEEGNIATTASKGDITTDATAGSIAEPGDAIAHERGCAEQPRAKAVGRNVERPRGVRPQPAFDFPRQDRLHTSRRRARRRPCRRRRNPRGIHNGHVLLNARADAGTRPMRTPEARVGRPP